jgi:shikimate kinase
MPGAGKSTVGRELARRLGWDFTDADAELERRCGASVSTIFEMEGEAGFRQREAALLDELTQRASIVLATGGGAVLRADNRVRLRERGLVIYLRATVDEILRRTRNDRSRPLLQVTNPRARLDQLLSERAPLYEEVAHLSFDSGAGNPRRLVERILDCTAVRTALGLPPEASLQ